jgi:hypothetical protein
MRRQFEELSIGCVTARIVECTFILVGIVCMLGIATLQQHAGGAAEATVAYTSPATIRAIRCTRCRAWPRFRRPCGNSSSASTAPSGVSGAIPRSFPRAPIDDSSGAAGRSHVSADARLEPPGVIPDTLAQATGASTGA